jgi:hypothetical protein
VISQQSEMLLQGRRVPRNLSVAEWRADLDTLAARMHRQIPYPEAATGGNRFDRRLDSLKQALPRQTRNQRILSVMRLTSLPAPGTGHTGLRSTQRAIGWRTLPIFPWRFADGVYIMSAVNPDWIGSEIVSVGGQPVDSVYAALGPYVGKDNRWDMWHDVEEDLLQFHWVDHLKALGIIDQTDEVPMRIRSRTGQTRRIRVETMRPDTPSWVRFLTTSKTRPDAPRDLQWSPGIERQSVKSPEPNYRVSYRDSSRVLYLDLNTIGDAADDWTMADLADSLGAIADRRPVDKMVVDLRTNGGGNASAAEPLVRLLSTHPKINRRGTLYTLISPVTYSAGGIFAMQMERRTKTLFAGEESAFAPNIWGEVVTTMLPNSKITVRLSHNYHQAGMPETPRTHLEPDLHVPMTSDQHFENVDGTMRAVKQHEPAPRETVSLSAAERDRFTGTYRLSPVHRVTITDTAGTLHLRMDRGLGRPFIDSDLHPLSAQRLATDITDVYVNDPFTGAGSEGALVLAWKDTTYTLNPVEGSFTLPVEHIRAGRLEEGAEGLRRALARGMKLGYDFTVYPMTDLIEENPLPVWPDTLSRTEKARRALPYAQLATELAPTSWLAFFELAYVHKLLGEEAKMRQAARRAVNFSPVRGARFVREYLDVTVTDDGEER